MIALVFEFIMLCIMVPAVLDATTIAMVATLRGARNERRCRRRSRQV